jgi:hypothetical protein
MMTDVKPRTKPDNYVYEETEILNYEYLKDRIDQIEENGVSDEVVAKAVEDYLVENDIKVDLTGIATEDFVRQELDKIELTKENGYVLHVSGADMMDNTPIYDIKPYLAFSDSIPDATGGFSAEIGEYKLTVKVDKDLLSNFPKEKSDTLCRILAEDPRPAYIEDENRIFGFLFYDHEIKFKVKEKELTVISVEKRTK